MDVIANDRKPIAKGKPVAEADKNHLPFLDGVRGLMALWVLSGHSIIAAGARLPIIKNPAAAVDIFMVISGLVMAYQFRLRETAEPWESPLAWKRFYLRRFFRIAPIYFLLLTIALMVHSRYHDLNLRIDSVFQLPWVDRTAAMIPTDFRHVMAHYTFVFGAIPKYSASTVLPDWSISLEMQFYAVFPLLMLSYRRMGGFAWTILGWLIWEIANQLWGVYSPVNAGPLGFFPQPSFLPLKLTLFMIGVLLAEAFHHRNRVSHTSGILVLCALMLSAYKQNVYVSAFAILCCLLLVYRRGADPLKIRLIISVVNGVLSSRFCRFLGDTSYSVYLVHSLFLIPLAWWLSTQAWYVHAPALARFAILLAGVATLSYGVGFLLFKWIERPGIALGRRLLKGTGPRLANKALPAVE